MPPLGEKRTKRFFLAVGQSTSWANIGGAADLGAALRDDVSTTYARGPTRDLPNNADALRLWAGSNEGDNVVLAADERISAAAVRIKVRGLGGSSVFTRMYWYFVRRSNVHIGGVRYESYLPSGVVEKQGTYHYRNADGLVWDQKTNKTAYPLMIDDCALYLKDLTSSNIGTGSRIAVEEAYLDYIVNRRPTVDTVAISSTTTTTQITTTWNWNDQDGDTQVAYEVKVFTSQQYGAAGFSPDTTTPEFGSGRLGGSATSLTLPINLRNGQAYRVYVRAAQDLPTRGDWWSDWAFASFTINVGTPLPPVLTPLTYDTPMDRGPILLSGRMNILSADDADFESTIGTWAGLTNVTSMLRSTVAPFNGVGAGRITIAGAGAVEARTGPYTDIRVGQTIGVGGRSRANSVARTFAIAINFYAAADGSGTPISTISSPGVLETVGSYTAWQSVSGVVPATTQSIRVKATYTNGAAAEIHDIDTIIVIPGAAPSTFSPGGVEPTATYEVQYADFPRLGNLVPAQIASGGETLGTAEGFYPRDVADQIGVSSQVVPFHGKLCIRWVPSVAGSILDIGTRFGDPFLSPFLWAAIPGKTYTHSVRLRLASGGPTNLTCRIRYLDSSLATISDFTQLTSVGAAWVESKPADSVAPAGTVFAMMNILNTGGLTGFPYFVDLPQFGETPAFSTSSFGSGQGKESVWRPMRGTYDPDTGVPTLKHNNDFSSAQEVTISDFEVRPDKIRVYRAKTWAPIAGETTASLWSNIVARSVDQLDWWLKHLTKPYLNLLIHPNVKPMVRLRATRKGVHEVMGSQYPVVIYGTTSAEQFSFNIALMGNDDFFKFREMLEDGSPLLLKGPERSWYIHVVGDAAAREWPKDSANVDFRSIPLEFVEVDVQ